MRRHNNHDMQADFQDNPEYTIAYRRMKKIKGFYVHLVIYILVNAFFLFIRQTQMGSDVGSLWQLKNFTTAFFWGMGLIGHALSVFGKDIFFGRNWEQRKIKQFMDNDKAEKWE